MGLRNLVFPTVEVQTSGGSLAVRGLSLDHILGLFYRHRADLSEMFEQAVNRAKSGKQATIEDATALSIRLIGAAPDIAAEIIAVASGSDMADAEGFAGDVGVARMLSLAEQIDALEKIAGQTFTSDMPPGKVLALLLQTMQAGSSAAVSLPKSPA